MNQLPRFTVVALPSLAALVGLAALALPLVCTGCGTASTGNASAKTGGYEDSRDDWMSRSARLERGMSAR